MKVDEVKIGTLLIGQFSLSIQAHPHQETSEYFSVFLMDNNTYVPLHEDPRFAHFQHLTSFTRKLTESDVQEYNAHVSSVFHKIGMPVFLLSRHSIVQVFEICQSLSKKQKKRQLPSARG